MTWTAYRVAFHLLAPMHMGWRKLGNLQQTRPYVTGRSLWGAFTAQLTREPGNRNLGYQKVGELVDEQLAFTYFYPSTSMNPGELELWPWPEQQWDKFAWMFLGSYASTALKDGHSVEEGSLHETEFIAPYARNKEPYEKPIPVFLVGYIFVKEGCKLEWKKVLNRLQLGGERSYGWGRVSLSQCDLVLPEEPNHDKKCFGYGLDCAGDHRPQITVPEEKALLAHTDADSLKNIKTGTLEPLVGRETGSDTGFGKNHSQARICWVPGSTVSEEETFQIQPRGIWERL